MDFKVVLCLIILAIVPFSYQIDDNKDANGKKLQADKKKRDDECGKTSIKDLQKLSEQVVAAKELKEKAKLEADYTKMAECRKEVKELAIRINNYESYAARQKEISEEKTDRSYWASLGRQSLKKDLTKNFLAAMKTLGDKIENTRKEIRDKTKEYLQSLLSLRQKDCPNKSEQDVHALAAKRSAAKSPEKEKLHQNWVDLMQCLEDVDGLKGSLENHGEFF